MDLHEQSILSPQHPAQEELLLGLNAVEAPAPVNDIASIQSSQEYESLKEDYIQELSCELRMPQPMSQAELEARLKNLLGRSIGELALLSGARLPYNNLAGKGFSGQLIELFLGADAHNLTLPDFTSLNIELKTLPLGLKLTPVESTFVCSTELKTESFPAFEQSPLCHKLKHILFVLLFAPKGFPIAERRILGYFFFKPNAEQLQTIKADYQDFAELICSGQSEQINGSMGTLIQMLPKASTADSLTPIRNSEGEIRYTRPRGFYLRRAFTAQLCQRFLDEQGITSKEIEIFLQRLALNAADDENA